MDASAIVVSDACWLAAAAAGVERYAVNTSICPGGCTSRFKQPLHLLSGFFHMHDLGKEIITRHYRNGR